MSSRLPFLGLVALLACSPAPPSPTVRGVTPSVVPYERATEVEINGDGFIPSAKTDLDHPSKATLEPYFVVNLHGPEEATAQDVEWVDNMHLKARIQSGLTPGSYSVEVLDGHGRRGSLPSAIAVVCTKCPDAGPPTHCDAGFLDLDRDGYGEDGGYGESCDVPRAPVAGDCNDFDSLTHPGAPQVCNGLDNDCSGAPPSCDAGFVAEQVDTAEWKVVAMAGAGDPWLAGAGGTLLDGGGQIARKSSGSFVEGPCPGRWTTGASDSSGTLYLGTSNVGNSNFSSATTSGTSCVELGFSEQVQMLRRVGTSGPIRGVTTSELIIWNGVPQFAPLQLGSMAQLSAVGGSSLSQLYVAGLSSGSPEVWQLVDGGFQPLGLAGRLPDARVVAVQGFDDGNAVAVGSGGGVAMYLGGAWTVAGALDGGSLNAAWAASPGRVYGVGPGARVWLFDGSGWTRVATPAVNGSPAFNAIDGTSEGDLWIAGDNGWVIHR
ncbi:MAG: putative metal-binding motif-containing protein [Myxococcaceae bacterium]